MQIGTLISRVISRKSSSVLSNKCSFWNIYSPNNGTRAFHENFHYEEGRKSSRLIGEGSSFSAFVSTGEAQLGRLHMTVHAPAQLPDMSVGTVPLRAGRKYTVRVTPSVFKTDQGICPFPPKNSNFFLKDISITDVLLMDPSKRGCLSNGDLETYVGMGGGRVPLPPS